MRTARTVTASPRSRVRAADALGVGAAGLRARLLRSALSALGIAISISALVAVLGIAASSRADLLAQLGAEGNLLTVASGQTFNGTPSPLPSTAEPMIRAIPPVLMTTAVGAVPGATVRRTAAIPPLDTGGISVLAAEPSLPSGLGTTMLHGHFLDAVSDSYPETVLGFAAARSLGIDVLTPATQVYLDGTYFAVVGIMAPASVAPELDTAALVSFPVAGSLLGLDGRATRIYVRVDPDNVGAVAAVLPFTASPAQPEAVQVRRPSDILVARIAAKTAFVGLFLALGAIGLLVGGVGIANTMVISVLERRGEIGLRRALGARGRHIALQFCTESALLSAVGGLLGAGLGVLATVTVARIRGTTATMPLDVPLGGFVAAMVVGALAGLYPAIRAARLAPADALRAP
ncbi:Macrolide export ATP-binding/permease protein MacB [Cellulomonas sp. T2.31MG-18]|uniref:ABC transporter permease n=1 Tax=Cellulomonas sp. T2.31MG-18 TaxID=3157619 RepID=UPI0035ED4AF2